MEMTDSDGHRLNSLRRGVWVPAFAGTTERAPYSFAAPTFENRRRIRIINPSQTSR
jgi:hypothetical protein